MAGGIVSRTPHFALHRSQLEGLHAAVGALVPKRWARRAVTRNAIKRQIYSVSALHICDDFGSATGVGASASSHSFAYVVRLRAAFDRKLFPSATSTALKQVVRSELHQLLAIAIRP